jgi:hypothetical protein
MNTLSPERKDKTTASMAPLICNGKSKQLYQHYLERIGEADPDDLSEVLRVQLGKHCGPFIIDWVERTEGHEITERERWITHGTLPWCGCTLDGYREFDDAVIEAKMCGEGQKIEDIVAWYAPQVVVQMSCRQAARGYLAILYGNNKLYLEPIEVDDAYRNEMWKRIGEFQRCVEHKVPPVEPPAPLTPPEKWRSFDLTQRPLPGNWAHAMIPALALWQSTREAAKLHEQSKADIKVFLPEDAGRVTLGGITVKRARNRAVSVTQEET